jgi:metal-responsive CopG/Arc/MetJ family transcriptional regulator
MAPKVKIGVSLEREILAEIDAIVESSKHLNISRSQVIESILVAFLKSPFDHAEKVRDLVLRRRRDLL